MNIFAHNLGQGISPKSVHLYACQSLQEASLVLSIKITGRLSIYNLLFLALHYLVFPQNDHQTLIWGQAGGRTRLDRTVVIKIQNMRTEP